MSLHQRHCGPIITNRETLWEYYYLIVRVPPEVSSPKFKGDPEVKFLRKCHIPNVAGRTRDQSLCIAGVEGIAGVGWVN